MKNLLITSIFCVLIAACSGSQEADRPVEEPAPENIVELTEAQLKNAGIVAGRMENRRISSVLKLNGMIDVPPTHMVSIGFPLGGYLKSTELLPGMHVRKGEVLAVMEDLQFIQLQQDYLTAQAKLVFSEGEFNRQKALNQSKASSDKLFQQTEADYMSQKILVKALFQKLQLIGINPASLNENNISRTTNIMSPIDGFVSEVHVNIGKYVNPSEVLFEIVNPEDIHLELNVFEKDINLLAHGQKVMAYTNANPEVKYAAEIFLIGKTLSQDRSIEVHCHFDQKEKRLVPGMFMNAEIEVQSKNAYTLPSEAIVNFENNQYVFLAKSNHVFEMIAVQTGASENGFTELVTAPDADNKDFVIQGAYALLMKLKNTSDDD